jgi:hypothetical protein
MSRKVWTALAGMILGSTTAHATIISTGMAFTPDQAECNVTNIGTKPVTVKSVTVIDALGAVHPDVQHDCSFPGQIFPGLNCLIIASTTAGPSHTVRCVIDTSSKSNIRATMTYFAGGNITAVLEAH